MKVVDCMKRNVVSIQATATIQDAVKVFVARHIGLLPVLDEQGKPIGAIGLRDMLALALPDFVSLVKDVNFVRDFGAAELAQPTPKTLAKPVTALMRPLTIIREDCGLLRAYALMRQRDLHDLPVVSPEGTLVGIVSRVDVATAVLAGWQTGRVQSDDPGNCV